MALLASQRRRSPGPRNVVANYAGADAPPVHRSRWQRVGGPAANPLPDGGNVRVQPGGRHAPDPGSGPFDELGGMLSGAVGQFLGAGQIALGLLLLFGGLSVLVAQTQAGGELARTGARAAKAGGKLAIKAAVL